MLLDDPAGDAESGFPDLTTGYGFVNEHAFYMFVEALDSGAPFDSFEIRFEVGPRRLWMGWAPGWDEPWLADITNDEWEDIGGASYSTFAFGPGLEARVDLRDLGSPDGVSLIEIDVMVGECCGAMWRSADNWSPAVGTPVVGEVDPDWRLSPSGGAREAERMLSAPDTRAITLNLDPQGDQVLVTALAGAVPGNAFLLVGNLEMNDFDTLRADAHGAFETEVAAAPGTHVLIKQDTTGRIIKPDPQKFDEDMIAPGVLLRIPVEEAAEGFSFGAGARLCCENEQSASWTIAGTFERDALAPGDEFDISGRVSVLADDSTRLPTTFLGFSAYMMGDADGRQVGRAGKFVTPFLTATGLPIERTLDGGPPLGKVWLGGLDVTWEYDGSRWAADFTTTLWVPDDMRTGLYALAAEGLWDLSDVGLEPAGVRPFLIVLRDSPAFLATIGAFTVGSPNPMRLATVLLADELSEGSRGGVLAREDRGQFDISPRALTRHDPVLPRLDGYGEAWVYRLEPYAPMLDAVDRSLPNAPALDLDFSDSELTIAVTRPDGGTDVLGPAPLTRYTVKSPRTPWGDILGRGGGELREIPQLQGDGDTFAYQFPSDGDYVVTLDGRLHDTGGRLYEICGTYDLTIANVLDIETALLPGTPFEVGDSIPIALTVMPGIPAQVTYTITHVAADGETTGQTFIGRANRYGWWDGDGSDFTFERDGEYRVDVEARYTGPDDNLWVGRLRFGSVVATPDSPMIVHGRRGPDGRSDIPPPWGFESNFVFEDTAHMQFPYFTGDVLWGIEPADGAEFMAGDAVVSHISVQLLDADHPLLAHARRQVERIERYEGAPLDDLIRAGQMPLITAPEPRREHLGDHPDDIDLWAYTYSIAQRPGVRVREIIQGDDVSGAYWRFLDAYNSQSGNGPEGDLPGDFKYLYAAAVVRDQSSGEGVYAIYGSGWVLARDDDPRGSRFMPPFRGAAGGPDGGPLFTLHDREVDMFFLPLGVRPGAVLEVGDVFRMAGPIMPTLPSRVEYTVTAPNGVVRTFDGRANAIGYLYDPDDDFVLDQSGLWTVTLAATHDGMTSAGPVEPPYPSRWPADSGRRHLRICGHRR